MKSKSLSLGLLRFSDVGNLSAEIQVGNSDPQSGAPSQSPALCASSYKDDEEMLLDEELLWFPTPLAKREELMRKN